MARTNKDFDARKEQLIQLALEQFIEKGYEKTTITDLQSCFGLTKGGMYHYFSSKEEILNAVIEYGLTQGAKELVKELEQIPLEKQFVYFFFSSTANDFTQKLFKYSQNNHSSIVTFRLREKNIEILAPILQNIVRQSIAAGLYTSEYPDEMSEFCLLLASAVTEVGILPNKKLRDRKKRIDALLHLWDKCMQPTPEHLKDLQVSLYSIIGLIEEKNLETENTQW